jgi:hypothetical protein
LTVVDAAVRAQDIEHHRARPDGEDQVLGSPVATSTVCVDDLARGVDTYSRSSCSALVVHDRVWPDPTRAEQSTIS